jgi:hypothetical protein
VVSEGFSVAKCDEECLALVERSPAAVAARDKAAWLSLFARYNLVEDPVGSSPHIGGVFDARSGYRSNARLSRFYETFIAPNTIRFHVDRDIVSGMHVVRDLTIEITMSPEVVVHVPVHLLYELTDEEGEFKIFRLAAHWELWPMLQQQTATGRPFLKVGSASALRMLRHLGVSGMIGFMRALSSVGDAGKAQAALFSQYFNAGNGAGLASLFMSPGTGIALPGTQYDLAPAEAAAAGGELRFSKVLAAGNVVSATVDYTGTEEHFAGVVFFELQRRSLRIVKADFYWSSPQ